MFLCGDLEGPSGTQELSRKDLGKNVENTFVTVMFFSDLWPKKLMTD